MPRTAPLPVALLALACGATPVTALPPGPSDDPIDRAAALEGLPGMLLVDVVERDPRWGLGAAVPGATVRAWTADTARDGTSGTAGRARWTDLPAGVWTLDIRHPCYRPRRVQTALAAGAGTALQVGLVPHPEPPAALGCGHPRRLIEPERAWLGVRLGRERARSTGQ